MPPRPRPRSSRSRATRGGAGGRAALAICRPRLGGIGHKAISVANTWRVLPTTGWRHAEPLLRRIVHWVASTEADRRGQPDRANLERARTLATTLPPDWASVGPEGDPDPGPTRALLGPIRAGDPEGACRVAADALSSGRAGAGAIWDAVHLAAAELLMARRDVTHPLHANTSANALRYAFRAADGAETRLFVLLQAVAWQGLFRRRVAQIAATDPGRALKPVSITELDGAAIPDDADAAAREVLGTLDSRPDEAALRAFALARRDPDPQPFFREARRLLPIKASVDAHDIKYPVAIFEDYALASPRWRPHLLASSVHWLQGSEKPDTPPMLRAREAARSLGP